MMPDDGAAFVCSSAGEMERELVGRPEEWVNLLRETGALPPCRGLKRCEHLIEPNGERGAVHSILFALGSSYLVVASHEPGETTCLLSRAAELLPEGLAAEIGQLQTAIAEDGDQSEAALMLNEMSRLNNRLVGLQRELERKNAELTRLNRRIREMSVTDSLTGVLNRRGFFEAARREIARYRRYRRTLSAIMLDIDHFSRINDTRGHGFGDRVLMEVASRCREQMRETDVLGRYGGEEFAAILPETGLEGAAAAAERIRRGVSETMEIEGESVTVTVSLGVSAIHDPEMALEELLDVADAALYRAKDAGRNRACIGEDG